MKPDARPYLEAVIEIGSTGIRLLVAEVTPRGDWKVIDRAERALSLARDVFTDGNISRETLLQLLAILNRYRETLSGWNLDSEHINVIATSAFREARNRDSILDRIAVKTGFSVHVIDGIEENRLMYLMVSHVLHGVPVRMSKANSIIMDIGGGSTEIMLLKKGKMVAAHSFRMGTVIIAQQIKAMMGSFKDLRRFMEEYIRTTAETLNNELRLDVITQLIASGSDARLVGRAIGVQYDDRYAIVSRDGFISFVERLCKYSVEEIVHNLRIGYNEAELLLPGLLAYRFVLEMTGSESVLIPYMSIREGYIISRLAGPEHLVREEFYTQVIASALTLGKKFHLDESHSSYVTRIALKLFDSLNAEHGLDRHARLLLETAAQLHDIGSFIRAADHHLHSQYIISHADIFGLNRDDMNIVSNVVRYHRAELPKASHPAYASLQRTDRTVVLKLSALLRIADALDRGHSQHIQDFDIELTADTLFLRAKGTHDITLERIALDEKADLFESVFGYKLIVV